MGRARRQKKSAKLHLTHRAAPGTHEKDEWEAYKGAVTTARYDRKYWRIEYARQLNGIAGWQAPVKYNRCKFGNGGHHCPPNLFEMRERLAAERKARESESQ